MGCPVCKRVTRILFCIVSSFEISLNLFETCPQFIMSKVSKRVKMSRSTSSGNNDIEAISKSMPDSHFVFRNVFYVIVQALQFLDCIIHLWSNLQRVSCNHFLRCSHTPCKYRCLWAVDYPLKVVQIVGPQVALQNIEPFVMFHILKFF